LSLRMAMRLNSLSLRTKFSIRCRHLCISTSMLVVWCVAGAKR
jgi:hypothetical protein